jgi:hypothetical protein
MMGISVSKSVALLLVLVFLTASCLMAAKPALSSAEVVENSWALKAPVPSSIDSLAVSNGKIYALARNVTYEYNPITNTWTTKNASSSSLSVSILAVYQNKIYAIEQGNGVI